MSAWDFDLDSHPGSRPRIGAVAGFAAGLHSGMRNPAWARTAGAAVGLAIVLILALLLVLRADHQPLPTRTAPLKPPNARSDVAVVLPGHDPPVQVAREDESARPLVRRRIARGTVFIGDSEPAGPGFQVTATVHGTPGQELARATTDADGAFSLECSVDERGDPLPPRNGTGVGSSVELCLVASSPDRRVLSAARLLQWQDCGPGKWIALHMSEGRPLSLRVVDGTGAPVPGGIARILTFRHIEGARWARGNSLSTWHEGIGDAEGRVTVHVRRGLFRAWTRTPGGPFGESVAGEVPSEGGADLGDVRAGSGSRSAVITVCDPDGVPIGGAGLAFDGVDLAVQGWMTHPDGTGSPWVHMKTGDDGKVKFPLADGVEQVLFGIAASGFRGVSVTLEPTTEPIQEYRVVLKRALECRVTLVSGPGKTPVTVGASLWIARRAGVGESAGDERQQEAGVESICLGWAGLPVTRSRHSGIHPLTVLEQAWGQSEEVRATGNPGEFSFHVRRPGEHLIRGKLNGNVDVSARIDVEEKEEVQEYPAEVPDGREVGLRVVLPDGDGGIGSRLQARDLELCSLWMDDGELFPFGWSDSREERKKVENSRIPLFAHGREPMPMESIWVPFGRNRLIVGPGYRAVGNLGEDEVMMFPIPVGPDRPEIVIRLPGPREERCGCVLRVHVRVPGGASPGDGVPVTLKGTFEDGSSCPARIAETDCDGTAEFVIGPGVFEVTVSPEEVKPRPASARIVAGEATREVVVLLGPGD